MTTVYYVGMFAILQLISLSGACIALNRKTPNCCLLIHAILVVVITAAPLLWQGTVLLELGSIGKTHDAENMCGLGKMSTEAAAEGSSWTSEIFKIVHRFDTITSALVSDNMCTDLCPCLNYTFDDGNMRSNSKLQFNMVMEKFMNKYRRTNFDKKWSTSKGNKPLVWTTDPDKGFKSFDECFQFWRERAS